MNGRSVQTRCKLNFLKDNRASTDLGGTEPDWEIVCTKAEVHTGFLTIIDAAPILAVEMFGFLKFTRSCFKGDLLRLKTFSFIYASWCRGYIYLTLAQIHYMSYIRGSLNKSMKNCQDDSPRHSFTTFIVANLNGPGVRLEQLAPANSQGPNHLGHQLLWNSSTDSV